ncbi:MAG: hypothetical protein L6R38_004143 [Xanthoria sp. 2 TBL-2021]|nr:MAG: hypothetical protein L6R38_004143 [Xanthoria sp. 2 TBL-2021]
MPAPPQALCGVVVSAGRMMKAVKVRTVKQVYDSFLQKHYTAYQSHLVSDPNSSLRTGDVVRIAARPPASKHIRHVVTDIVAPWGPPAEERPPIPSLKDLDAQYRAKRDARIARRTQRMEEARAERAGARAVEKGPSLKERHTDVVGGPEAVGGEERVVLERNMGDS